MPSSKISQILNSTHEGGGFHYKLLEEGYFIVEMTGPTTLQPASSDFRKASLVSSLGWPTDLRLLIPSSLGQLKEMWAEKDSEGVE